MRKLLGLLCLLPTLAFGNANRGIVGTSKISTLSPAHYVYVIGNLTGTVASGTAINAFYPADAPARLVDVIWYQSNAGVGGTSYTMDVKTVAGTSLLSALGVATLASGADKNVDAKGALALPTGWTRPVLKTDTTVDVVKGQRLLVNTVETGTYSTHAFFVIVLVFEPKQ